MKFIKIITAAITGIVILSVGNIPLSAADSQKKIPIRTEFICESVAGVKVHDYSNGMFVIEDKNHRFGYVDSDFNDVIKPQYDSALAFQNGVAVVSKNGKYGGVDITGKTVIPFQYDSFGQFQEGLALVAVGSKETEYSYVKGKYGFVDLQGRIKIPLNCDRAEPFYEGYAIVTKDGKSGFVNTQGKLAIPCQFDQAYSFQNGYAAVRVKDKWGVINKQGQFVISPVWDGIMGDGENGVYAAMKQEQGERYRNLYGIVTVGDNVVLQPVYDEYIEFYKGYANVQASNGKYGLMDKAGKWAVKPQYSAILFWQDNDLIAYTKNGTYGYMDFREKVVIKPQFSMAYSFSDGTAGVQQNGGTGIINAKGEYLISPSLGYIEIVRATDSDFMIAQKQNKTAVYQLIYE